jgi:ketosteroid isomerase-like protein
MLTGTLGLSAQQSDEVSELQRTISDLNNKMAEAILAQDHDKILSFYDDKVISMPNYEKMIRGIDAFAKAQEESAESGNKVTAMKLMTKKVMDHGDIVIEIGKYDITMEIEAYPLPVSDAGKYLNIWKKHGKTYKILIETWNTDVNPMEMMKKGENKSGDAPVKPGPQEKNKPKPKKMNQLKSENDDK